MVLVGRSGLASTMNLSKRSEYALRAMIHLGIAEELKIPFLSGKELADVNRLPLKFIERILQELREAGLIQSKRGKAGGYSLSKESGEIKMGDLVRLMDGRIAPLGCASEGAYERCTCPDEDHCGLRMLMIDVRNAIANILDRYSLAQVVEVTLRKMRREGIAPPFAHLLKPDLANQGESPKNHADPADGFLASLAQLTSPDAKDGTEK